MNEYKIIAYVSSFIWLLVPIKHFKTRYFLYFLSLTLISVFGRLLRFIGSSSNLTSIVFDLLATYFLYKIIFKQKDYINISALCFAVALFSIMLDDKIADNWIMLIINLTALFIIIINFLNFAVQNKTVTLFYIIFIFYQTLNVLKLINAISFTKVGVLYYFIILFIQIFIGIFFLFVNEDTNKFIIYRFKSGEDAEK